MRISYSQIDWFLRCPYLFKYQFIDGNRLARGKSAVFGGILHKVMEHLYKEHPLFPTLSEALGFYERLWEERRASSFFLSELDASVHFKEGMRIIKEYYDKHGLDEVHVLSLEKRFSLSLEDPQTREVHIIAGQIDRIDKTPDVLEIIDYKTGRELRSEEQVRSDLQLGIYHVALDALWPQMVMEHKDRVVASLYFLRHQQKVSTKKGKKDIAHTKEILLEYLQKIQDAIKKDAFEAKPSSLCQIEPYNRICPYFKDRYRTQKPKIQGKTEVGAVVKEYSGLKEQERETKKRLAALGEMINEYMDQEGLEGIFDGNEGITRVTVPLYQLNAEAVRAALEPLGKWQEVLEVSKSKLQEIAKELPEETRKQIANAQTVKSKSRSLRVKKLKA